MDVKPATCTLRKFALLEPNPLVTSVRGLAFMSPPLHLHVGTVSCQAIQSCLAAEAVFFSLFATMQGRAHRRTDVHCSPKTLLLILSCGGLSRKNRIQTAAGATSKKATQPSHSLCASPRLSNGIKNLIEGVRINIWCRPHFPMPSGKVELGQTKGCPDHSTPWVGCQPSPWQGHIGLARESFHVLERGPQGLHLQADHNQVRTSRLGRDLDQAKSSMT
eukprot:1427480-Amphidinium_carterae.2